MRTLITTDLHFTDAALDEYRWGLFDWLHELIQAEDIECLFILGDLTDAKDKHSAKLVNKLVHHLGTLADVLEVGGVHILKGNHDYLDPACPFFSFLSKVPRIWFYSEPRHFTWENSTYTFLPHCKNPESDWPRYNRLLEKSDYVFIHATAKGAEVSNGFAMPEGLDPDYFSDYDCKIFSGDVHVPQGPACTNEKGGRRQNREGTRIRYVGSPYRIRFGDNYRPRVCVLDSATDEVRSIPSSIDLWKGEVKISEADDLRDMNLQKGDQIKVLLESGLTFSDAESKRIAVRKACKDLGVVLCAIRLEAVARQSVQRQSGTERKSEGELLLEYAGGEDITLEVVEAGLEILP